MALRLLILVLLLAGMTHSQTPPIEPGVSLELAKWRAAHYSDIRYKLNLTLEKMSPVLKGTIEIRVKVSEPPASAGGQKAGGPVPPIILDWRRIKGHEEKSTISNVSLNGVALSVSPLLTRGLPQPAAQVEDQDAEARASARAIADRSYEEYNEHLIFTDGVVQGENVIRMDFTSPILTSGSAITRYIDKEDGSEYIYSLFVPSDASTAFPVFDQPDLKARFLLNIRRPASWKKCVAISNAPALAVNFTDGWEATEFVETKPISSYVFAFAVGDFAQFRQLESGEAIYYDEVVAKTFNGREYFIGDEVEKRLGTLRRDRVYVRRSQARKFQPHAAEVFRLNREAIKYFEEYFNYKFPFPKYDLVLIPEFPFGGMEHAGATFLRESAIIFPQEPTRNDHISRALLIFHEASHQWFGDTVTMRWFDDLWLKEGFATFTAYKAMERIMPEMMAWKVFYERVKQAAYQTDSTKGTTPIYQEIPNLSAAKSAYGNIVYNKAPAFLRQAEFYLGEDKFQTAVRAFLKKHEFGNAGWEDLVAEFEAASEERLKSWAEVWINQKGVPLYQTKVDTTGRLVSALIEQTQVPDQSYWLQRVEVLGLGNVQGKPGRHKVLDLLRSPPVGSEFKVLPTFQFSATDFVFPNSGDYGYGIFLLDDKSRDYVLKNIQNEKDPFLRSMMWGALWDSVREGELDPREFVELAIKQLGGSGSELRLQPRENLTPKGVTLNGNETDETIVALLVSRVSTALNYYMSEPPAVAGGLTRSTNNSAEPQQASTNRTLSKANGQPPATAGGSDLRSRFEAVLLDRMRNATTAGERITFYRAFLNNASSENARNVLKTMLSEPPASAGGKGEKTSPTSNSAPTRSNSAASLPAADAAGSDRARIDLPLRTKDKFDIITRLLILGDADAPRLLAELERTETSDDAKRYAYAARAGIATAENKVKYWKDFTENKEISESWIQAAFGPFNSIRHSELTLPYLERALKELPNHKRDRKIFFVNGWLGAFIGGQRSEESLNVINKFLADNPTLDRDLRLKILENADIIERAVRIRGKYSKPRS
ncbi:MAG: hypothetical protein KF881_09060 [Acidobacteria bacterium]|nr:hypothetical protein [Acidobacteriota bacterium]